MNAYTWLAMASGMYAMGQVEIPDITSSVERTVEGALVGCRRCAVAHHFVRRVCPIFGHTV